MKKALYKKLQPLIAFSVFVLICVVLHSNFLFPWQSLNRDNRKAMLSYIDENYPKAKIIEKDYNKPQIWAPPSDDGLKVRWNGVEFWIRAGYGEISYDTYAEKQKFTNLGDLVYYGFCVPFSAHASSHQSAAEMRPTVICKAEDGSAVTDFYNHNGKLMIDVYIDQNTSSVGEIDWLWDFCWYMSHKFSLHIGREDYEYRVIVKLASGVILQHTFQYGKHFGGIEGFSHLFHYVMI